MDFTCGSACCVLRGVAKFLGVVTAPLDHPMLPRQEKGLREPKLLTVFNVNRILRAELPGRRLPPGFTA